jgi:hypothetical protein
MSLHLRLGLSSPSLGDGIPLDPDAEALIAAMTPTPDVARQALINTLIVQLKADGIWPLLDILYVVAAHAAQPARLNWKNPTGPFNLAAISAPTFTVDRGYEGNGTTSYLDTGWAPIGGVQFLLNSAHLAGWSLSSGAADGNQRLIGNLTSGTGRTVLIPRAAGDEFFTFINDATGPVAIPCANRDGFFVSNRSGASAREFYRNGTSLGSDAVASTDRNTSQLLFDRDTTIFSTMQVAHGSAGASLSAGQVSDYYEALLTYMLAVGAATPADIFGASLTAWWDAGFGITVTGSGVSNWASRVGAFTLVQATDVLRPPFSATGWDGVLPAVSGDGAAIDGDILSATGPFAAVQTVFIAAERGTQTNDAGSGVRTVLMTGVASGGASADIAVERPGIDAGQTTFRVFGNGGAGTNSLAPDPFAIGQKAVLFGQVTDNDLRARVNLGAAGAAGDFGTGSPTTTVTVFGNPGVAVRKFNGKIAEIVVVNRAVTDQERIQTVNYLMDKWSI